MSSRLTLALVGASLAVTLAACGGSESAGDLPAKGSDIGASSSSLGTIVVDGKGMTAYVFDKDTPGSGKSACTGACAGEWPAVVASSDTPKVDGVTGKIGTITGADGSKQITLEGMPLYTYADDTAAGETEGQGKGGIWWVVSPAGEKISKTADTGGGGAY